MDKAIDADTAREVAQKVQEHKNDEFADQFKKSGIMEDVYQKISTAANRGRYSVVLSTLEIMRDLRTDRSIVFVVKKIMQTLSNRGYQVSLVNGLEFIEVDWGNCSGEIKRKWRRWITS